MGRYLGMCDKDGCDFNSYRMGDTSFYGHGSDFKIDSSKPVTVVTQFLTHDGTDTGDLSEVRRFYVQDGAVIENSEATILGSGAGNSITDDFCSKQKSKFGDLNDFAAKPGVLRGPCPSDATSEPKYLRATVPDSHAAFSQIKVGEIGSTYGSGSGRRLAPAYI